MDLRTSHSLVWSSPSPLHPGGWHCRDAFSSPVVFIPSAFDVVVLTRATDVEFDLLCVVTAVLSWHWDVGLRVIFIIILVLNAVSTAFCT